MSNIITKDQALKAYDTLRDYCKEQNNCINCLLVVSSDGLHPDCCLMHLAETPVQWQDLELD